MTFLELAERILREEKKPLAIREIWNIAENKGYTADLRTQGKTPWATLGAIIYVNARDNKDSVFIFAGGKPKKFYLKGHYDKPSDLQKIETPNNTGKITKQKISYSEKDLHPFLAYFAYQKLKKCYIKTINHSVSKKKEYGEWVHPDIVGCYFPIGYWSDQIFDLSKSVGNNPIKIISFELKKELSLGTLRENFFQTVSNSSWANESYLVAADISKNDDFLNELTRLSTSFGIGVIRFDVKEPDSSEIMLPAKTRSELDWDTINKLLTINKDFKYFIERITGDINHKKEVAGEKYDKVYKSEELVKRINKV